MTRDEWAAYAEQAPATRNQVGAAHGEFKRLGFRDPWDRAERLDLAADLLGLDGLDSFNSLTRGDAGMLVAILQNAPDAASIRQRAEDARKRNRPRHGLAALLGLLGDAVNALTSAPKGTNP